MASKAQIRREAVDRQGKHLVIHDAPYLVEGDESSARFREGMEGLVHLAFTTSGPTTKRRVKVFWIPDEARRERSRYLVGKNLSDEKRKIDVLGGAPYAMLEGMGEFSRFALVMKNVEGASWKDLLQKWNGGVYPPLDWPPQQIRLLWSYGLTVAVQRMEERGFVHADLSDGNVVVESAGPHAGAMALVDFDGYHHEKIASNYRGTAGFAAPEIFRSGAMGVGSDRVAMAILIQDFLIVGDPALDREEAFRQRYTSDEICELQAKAHPLFQQKYPSLAALLEITLQSRDRMSRPAPQAWGDALLALYSGPSDAAFELTSLEGQEGAQVVRLGEGRSKDLLPTRFAIRAAIARGQDGLRLRPHRGAALKVKHGDDPWQGVKADFPLRGECLLFDPQGKYTARFVPAAQGEKAGEAITTITPQSFLEGIGGGVDWRKAFVTGAIVALCLLLLLLLWAHNQRLGPFYPLWEQSATINPPATVNPSPRVFPPRSADAPPPPLNPPPVNPPVVKDQATRATEVRATEARATEARAAEVRAAEARAAEARAAEVRAAEVRAAEVRAAEVRAAEARAAEARAAEARRHILSNGTFTWQGEVNGSTLVVIENGIPSFGVVYGTPLPGVMCFLQYSDHRHFSIAEAPAVSNKWNKVVLNVQGKGTMTVKLTWALP